MKPLNRRQFVTRMSLSAAAAVAFSKLGYSSTGYLANPTNAEDYINKEITQGKIRGIRTEGVNIFKGIPYGDSSFRLPAPLELWPNVRDTLQLGTPAELACSF